jgi:hypothetical protein
MRATRDGHVTVVQRVVTVNAPPAVDFAFEPVSPLEDEPVLFRETVADPENDSITSLEWAFGDGGSGTGSTPSHTYAEPGDYTVVLTATDVHGASASASRQLVVREDPGPTASFVYAPLAPMTGETVTFTSTSTPSAGSITDLDWDLDDDGEFDDFHGSPADWSFASAGTHRVLLRVRQSNGSEAVSFADLDVAAPPEEEPPPAEQPPPDGQPVGDSGLPELPLLPRPAVRPRLMSPFPVVRIAGAVLPRGAQIRILSVRAPRGARVLARCRGRGCPVGSVARTSATGMVRFRRYERRLRAGIRLELFVRQTNRIGKYTRFRIRAGAAPKRFDSCLYPRRAAPARCP